VLPNKQETSGQKGDDWKNKLREGLKLGDNRASYGGGKSIQNLMEGIARRECRRR